MLLELMGALPVATLRAGLLRSGPGWRAGDDEAQWTCSRVTELERGQHRNNHARPRADRHRFIVAQATTPHFAMTFHEVPLFLDSLMRNRRRNSARRQCAVTQTAVGTARQQADLRTIRCEVIMLCLEQDRI